MWAVIIFNAVVHSSLGELRQLFSTFNRVLGAGGYACLSQDCGSEPDPVLEMLAQLKIKIYNSHY